MRTQVRCPSCKAYVRPKDGFTPAHRRPGSMESCIYVDLPVGQECAAILPNGGLCERVPERQWDVGLDEFRVFNHECRFCHKHLCPDHVGEGCCGKKPAQVWLEYREHLSDDYG